MKRVLVKSVHGAFGYVRSIIIHLECQMDFEQPENTAKEGIMRFRSFLKSIGMPLTFAELGAREEDIPLLVEKFGIGDGKTGGFVKLSGGDIEQIYRIAVKPELIDTPHL